MSKSYILKNGLIATFDDQDNKPRTFRADVHVKDTIIADIGLNIAVPAGVEVINCTNKWIAPGMVDTHRSEQRSSTKKVVLSNRLQTHVDGRSQGVTVRVGCPDLMEIKYSQFVGIVGFSQSILLRIVGGFSIIGSHMMGLSIITFS